MLRFSLLVAAFVGLTGCAKTHPFNTYTALGESADPGNCRWIVRHAYENGAQSNDVLLYCCGGVVREADAAQPTWNRAPSCIKAEHGSVVTPSTPVAAPAGPKENLPPK